MTDYAIQVSEAQIRSLGFVRQEELDAANDANSLRVEALEKSLVNALSAARVATSYAENVVKDHTQTALDLARLQDAAVAPVDET